MKRILGAAIVFGLLVGTSESQAATLTFLGSDNNTGGGALDTPAERVNSDAARAQWLANVLGVQTETFDNFVLPSPPSQLNPPLNLFGPGSGTTLSGDGFVETVPVAGITAGGRYPTSGTQFFETGSNASSSAFTIAFATPVSAFGFYGIDMFDFNGQFTLTITRQTGPEIIRDIEVTEDLLNASLLFFGLVETDLTPGNLFTSLTLRTTSPSTSDFFGVDDFSVGAFNPAAVPEPGSLLLLGTGIAAFARRRRSNQTK